MNLVVFIVIVFKASFIYMYIREDLLTKVKMKSYLLLVPPIVSIYLRCVLTGKKHLRILNFPAYLEIHMISYLRGNLKYFQILINFYYNNIGYKRLTCAALYMKLQLKIYKKKQKLHELINVTSIDLRVQF